MDLKGIGKIWADNICSKFEAIYSEVDGFMSQEVAKMQSVGINIKKVYDGVIEDLLPSSCINSIKDKDSDKSVEKNLASIKVLDPLPEEDSGEIAAVDKDSLLPSSDLIEKSVSDVSLDYNGYFGDSEKLSALTEVDCVTEEDSSLSKAPEFIYLSAEVPQVRESHHRAYAKIFGARIWIVPKTSVEVTDESYQQDGLGLEFTKKSEMSLQTSVEVTEESTQQDGSDKAFALQSEMSPQTSVEVTEESFHQDGLENEFTTKSEMSLQTYSVEVTEESSGQDGLEKDLITISEISPQASVEVTEESLLEKEFATQLEMSPRTYSVEVMEESSQQDELDMDFITESKMSPQTSVEVTGQSSQQGGLDKALSTPLEMSSQSSVEVTEEEPQQKGWETYNILAQNVLNGDCPSALPSSLCVASVLSCEDEVLEIGANPSNRLLVESNGMESSTCGLEEYNKQGELEAISSPAEIGTYDDSSTEQDESDDAVSIDKLEDVELDDKSIVVHSNEFLSATGKASHQRSYKKKIQDALASRKRSGKKVDDELLAFWYADIEAEERQRSQRSTPWNFDLNSSSNDDSDESDWEIL